MTRGKETFYRIQYSNKWLEDVDYFDYDRYENKPLESVFSYWLNHIIGYYKIGLEVEWPDSGKVDKDELMKEIRKCLSEYDK